ncbi:MAG: hypothetical protein KF901_33415, partial [Myxococcales bacterium]|nr:hypothetical protein [Myxococcales bacterium]
MKATRILKLFQARNVAVRLVTFEEAEVRDLIFEVAGELGLVPWVWSATGGVMTGPLAEAQPIPQTTNPGAALFTMRMQRTRPTMLVTLDLADHLAGEPVILRALRELIEDLRREETSSVYADGVASRLA